MGEVKITEKSTKAQILEAYNQQKEEIKELRAMKDSPVEEAKEKELKASLENAEVAAKNPVFAEPIVKQYEDLKLATQKKSEELKELYGIETEMGDLAVAINTHRSKMASMDEEYQQKKTELDSELDKKQMEVKEQIAELDKSVRKAKSAADEEIAEYNAELHKKRVREADEYEYNKKLNHRIDDDEWAAEKAQREAEEEAKKSAKEAEEQAKEQQDLLSKMNDTYAQNNSSDNAESPSQTIPGNVQSQSPVTDSTRQLITDEARTADAGGDSKTLGILLKSDYANLIINVKWTNVGNSPSSIILMDSAGQTTYKPET